MVFSTATEPRNHNNVRRAVRRPDEIRHRALARLYERKIAVDSLIHALERYQQERRGPTEKEAVTTAGEMSS